MRKDRKISARAVRYIERQYTKLIEDYTVFIARYKMMCRHDEFETRLTSSGYNIIRCIGCGREYTVEYGHIVDGYKKHCIQCKMGERDIREQKTLCKGAE